MARTNALHSQLEDGDLSQYEALDVGWEELAALRARIAKGAEELADTVAKSKRAILSTKALLSRDGPPPGAIPDCFERKKALLL